MTKVTEVTKLVPKESFLPDGVYSGDWGGYVVTLTYKGETYKLKTVDGVRCMSCPCTVTVANGEVTVNG